MLRFARVLVQVVCVTGVRVGLARGCSDGVILTLFVVGIKALERFMEGAYFYEGLRVIE